MTKHYDYPKAKAICEERQPVTASLGMHEDWGWTADTVWKDGKFLPPTDNPRHLIAGISSSHWATPVLLLEMPNGDELFVECFTDDKVARDDGGAGEMFAKATQGCVTGPCQNWADSVPVEKSP